MNYASRNFRLRKPAYSSTKGTTKGTTLFFLINIILEWKETF